MRAMTGTIRIKGHQNNGHMITACQPGETVDRTAVDIVMVTLGYRTSQYVVEPSIVVVERAQEERHGGTVLRPFNGNRAQLLESLADSIDNLLPASGAQVTLTVKQVHDLHGMCEQLRIIADDMGK